MEDEGSEDFGSGKEMGGLESLKLGLDDLPDGQNAAGLKPRPRDKLGPGLVASFPRPLPSSSDWPMPKRPAIPSNEVCSKAAIRLRVVVLLLADLEGEAVEGVDRYVGVYCVVV